MRVAASTHVGESSLSEENDIYVRTPEDGKNIRCSFNSKKKKKHEKKWYYMPTVSLRPLLLSKLACMKNVCI
jgi:hypothetical protein